VRAAARLASEPARPIKGKMDGIYLGFETINKLSDIK
jgi:hypothetical protein